MAKKNFEKGLEKLFSNVQSKRLILCVLIIVIILLVILFQVIYDGKEEL